MTPVKTINALMKVYESCSDPVKWYFDQIPSILPELAYEVSLAYLFLRTERAQNVALYCGAVKLHSADSEVTWKAISAQHLTRDGFAVLYNNVFGAPVATSTRNKIERAEKIRDLVVHGKDVDQNSMREAIRDVFHYAELMNTDLQKLAGFKPFGNLRGFKGRAVALDKKTSRWLLKGLGFHLA